MRTFRFKNSIIFSDETTIWLHDNSHCGWFHNNIKQELSINRHAGKINVWGAISVRGKVGITTFTETLNAKLYRDILDEHLIDNIWNRYPTNWYFQQDDDSKHTANKAIEFLENNVPSFVGVAFILSRSQSY